MNINCTMAPSPSMSVNACGCACLFVCLCVCVHSCWRQCVFVHEHAKSVWGRMCMSVCLCVCACVRACAHMHPPSPEAVLCIVVGMAYMLSQACSSVVQCTRLPIRAALPLSCPQAASFTFAPELMLVNCHINSDLLPHFVNNTNQAGPGPTTCA